MMSEPDNAQPAIPLFESPSNTGDTEPDEEVLKTAEELQNFVNHTLATLTGEDLASFIETLGTAIFDRQYKCTGKLIHLQIMLNVCIFSVQETPEGQPDLARQLHLLTQTFVELYQMTSDPDYLNSSLIFCHKAVSENPEDDPSLLELFHYLGFLYEIRYTQTWNLKDLDAGIEHLHSAMSNIGKEGYDVISSIHHKLAALYVNQFKENGAATDLEQGQSYSLLALSFTANGHPELVKQQQGVAAVYGNMYRSTGKLDDLENALRYRMIVMEGTPDGHPFAPQWKQDLATCYQDRYKRTGNKEDLQASLDYCFEAVAAIPLGHPDLPWLMQGLSVGYTLKNEYGSSDLGPCNLKKGLPLQVAFSQTLMNSHILIFGYLLH